jgi:uncharacterized protein (DUF433 family)
MKDRIVTDPKVCGGKPFVRGTQITVREVIEFLAAGQPVEGLLNRYKALTPDDVIACLDYAAKQR